MRKKNTGAGGNCFKIWWLSLAVFLTVAVTVGSPGLDAQEPKGLPDALSGRLPYDVDPTEVRKLVREGKDHEEKILEAQRLFDLLAWQAFIALNWPADEKGGPDEAKTLTDAGPRVWEFWRPSDTIFLGNGAEPEGWTDKEISSSHLRWKAAWRQHTTQSSSLEAFSGPLVDQNGKWVRYQIRVNKPEFTYIFSNKLYSQDGQAAFSQKESDNQVDLPLNQGHHEHGAIEIKFAWKELGANDDAGRFFTTDLLSDVSEPTKPGEPPPQRPIHAGLVGMHISMRTQSSPEWIWATFEHVDNVRVNHDASGKETHPNFFNPEQPQPVNVLPAANAVEDPHGNLRVISGVTALPDGTAETASKWVESLTTKPVQAARIPVPTQPNLNPWDEKTAQVAKDVNGKVQALLHGAHSVFENYELIDVQWPLHPDAPAAAGGNGSAPESITHKTPGDMIPVFLVNTTMETYFQKGPQEAGGLEQDDRLPPNSPGIDPTHVIATESCVGCHYSSGITTGFKKNADGQEILDPLGQPTAVFGENNHFGKTGNASFSWMLQLEARPVSRNVATTTDKTGAVPGAATPKLPGLRN